MPVPPQDPSRRRFLKQAAALSLAPSVIPAAALGKGEAAAPSERIVLGFIGIGMMGRGHLRCFLGFDDAQVVAVCDVDRWRRENAKTTADETYAERKPSGTYHGCTAYTDLRELLAREDVDGVVIATGDRWHPLATILAAKAGKDVYCEKPVSCTIREARAMIDTVRRYDRVFQTGLQQRSAPEFRKACDLVKSGAIGRVKVVYVGFPGTSSSVNLPAEPVPEGLDWDLWLGPAPWRPFNNRFHHYQKPRHVVPWHFCRDFGGGNLTSNAVHAFDVVQWGLGMDESGPVEVIPPETGRVPSLTFKYPGNVVLQVEWKLDPQKHFVPEGWDVNTRIQNFGALFVGRDGWIHVGRNGYLKSYPEAIVGDAEWPEHKYAVTSHQHGWLDCMRSRQRPACDVAFGAHSTMVSHLGCIAHWTGRALKWDPAAERFLDDDEANRLLSRPKRAPWRI